jgi:hypothetical protein
MRQEKQEQMKVKVVVVYKDLEDKISEESIWTEKLENGYYRIDNIPFYAPNLAYNDMIAIEEDEGVFYFADLIERSGHSTIQIIFFKENEIEYTLSNLEKLGCAWEGMKNQAYFSVDIPPNINYLVIKEFLDEQAAKDMLDYKESCLSEKQ